MKCGGKLALTRRCRPLNPRRFRLRFPKGLVRSLIKTAPREYVQHARNPANNVKIGGNATVFAPVYGPPFMRDLDGVRRYATIEDFRNFVKLAYLHPILHPGGTVCEPVDMPVNKRHLDMVYSHIKYSDKPFMGSVTPGERGGTRSKWPNPVRQGLCRQEYVMTPDQRQLSDGFGRDDARRFEVYARANQAWSSRRSSWRVRCRP